MAEEQTDANAVAEGSSTSTETELTASTTSEDTKSSPNGSEVSTEKKEVPFHEHPRFKELIEEKNNLKTQVEQMQNLLAERQTQANRVNIIESTKQKFVSAGMDEKVADLLANSQAELARGVTEERVASLEASNVQHEIDSWLNNFQKDHGDYAAMEPEMDRVFRSLPEETKNMIVSAPQGVQLLYDHVKAMGIDKEKDTAYKKGVEDAYANKVKKGAMTTSSSGSAVPTKYSNLEELNKAVDNMSIADYKKNKVELIKMANELASKA